MITHDFKQNGLTLKAKITIGDSIKVDASITNNSGNTIIYNKRCGIPFMIYVQKEDAYTHLIASGEKAVVCEDIFDPNDLKEMKPNETFNKKITFKREVRLTNESSVHALSGMYDVYFSFQMQDKERFLSKVPIELKMDKEPEIMTVDQAKAKAKENKEVREWFDEHEKENLIIKSEDAILSDGMWTVMFHTLGNDTAGISDRMIINMDAKSGDIKGIHYEEFDKEALEFLDK
ncbi:hypothetical protein M3194_12725 [Paenibacillus glycanilyticus]|uniref:hypothetical protein n=1 Tax=Paenibacillus glycanilyticus TaxID=126569 RepID=UPI002041BDF0|nr:hypothetical protein [Paenibacillus glycanilyticus]MCM3628229.1 hypothetical protein [Paenibacillus glycanilyticus]